MEVIQHLISELFTSKRYFIVSPLVKDTQLLMISQPEQLYKDHEAKYYQQELQRDSLQLEWELYKCFQVLSQ